MSWPFPFAQIDEQPAVRARNEATYLSAVEGWLRDEKTRYGITDAFGLWWVGDNKWSVNAAPARWFDTWTAAELAGLRELHEARHTWTVILIPESAY